jgi:hypothetical protein
VKQSWNKRHFKKLTLLILQCNNVFVVKLYCIGEDEINKKTPLQKPARAFRKICLWRWTESNRRHMDFQSIALPTELHLRLLFRSDCKCMLFYCIEQIQSNFFLIFFQYYNQATVLIVPFMKGNCIFSINFRFCYVA